MSVAVLLIDGRSGSGKTSLAARLAGELAAQTLHLEDLYPGWDGLAEGSVAVAGALERGGYRPYDWVSGGFSEARIVLDPSRPLIIEGCGAVTHANLAAARRWAERAGLEGSVRGVWLECPESVRRERALARDGETFAPHWQRWAEQENAHFAEHEPWALAREVQGVLLGQVE